MAYTPLKISIPEPCDEDWNGMHPVAGTTARHCDSCAKNVVDFTGFPLRKCTLMCGSRVASSVVASGRISLTGHCVRSARRRVTR